MKYLVHQCVGENESLLCGSFDSLKMAEAYACHLENNCKGNYGRTFIEDETGRLIDYSNQSHRNERDESAGSVLTGREF